MRRMTKPLREAMAVSQARLHDDYPSYYNRKPYAKTSDCALGMVPALQERQTSEGQGVQNDAMGRMEGTKESVQPS